MSNTDRHMRLVLFLLVFVLAFVNSMEGCPTAFAKTETQNVEDTSQQLNMGADEAFEEGNICYKDQQYEKAVDFYMYAMDNQDTLIRYSSFDVRNNMVLAYLEMEKSQEALDMCKELFKEARTECLPHELYGYACNLMVCAEQCGISVGEIADECFPVKFMDNLLELWQLDPEDFSEIMVALIYNAVYIDEHTGKDELKKHLFDYGSDSTLSIRAGLKESRVAFLDELDNQLRWAYSISKQYCDVPDEDIQELSAYITAKIEYISEEKD